MALLRTAIQQYEFVTVRSRFIVLLRIYVRRVLKLDKALEKGQDQLLRVPEVGDSVLSETPSRCKAGNYQSSTGLARI